MDNDTRYKTTRLYVPKESIEKYEQKAAWNCAKGIYPLYPTDSISLPKEVSVILAKPTKIEYTIKLTVENRCLKVGVLQIMTSSRFLTMPDLLYIAAQNTRYI